MGLRVGGGGAPEPIKIFNYFSKKNVNYKIVKFKKVLKLIRKSFSQICSKTRE